MKVKRRIAVVAVSAIVMGLTQLGTIAAQANTPVNGAAFTTTNTNIDGTGHCKNGNEDINCNIYDGKDFVWLNGGPAVAYVGDGDYFFAVLAPGGQADPNDGAAKNLSDESPTSNTGAGDDYTNRTFSVTGGIVTYGGTHDVDSNKIRLMGYDDTTNNGGVYILAICSLADGYPANASDCKYDAFKVHEGDVTEADAPTVTKDADGAYDTTFTWDIEKNVDQTLVQQIGGTATFTYTVHVTHDEGTIGNIQVTGTITVFNPNPANVTGADVTDTLSDNTVCPVTDGSNATLAPGDNEFAYTCSLSALPQGQLDNTAEVAWSAQDVGGLPLAGGSADFTFPNISFANTNVDDCTTVTDPVPAGGTSTDNPFVPSGVEVCVGGTGDGGAGTGALKGFTFVYHTNYPVPANGCMSYTNIAAESTSGNNSSVTVRVCGPARTGALTIGFWKNTNGNGLISNYCAPASKTSLATYLSSLGAGSGPFTGAAGKSCNQLVTYVNGIIQGATATNMNIMLRAQMLATALDVYFSDPNLGWTSTKAGTKKQPSVFFTGTSPLGLFVMDLTAICPMIDNTTAGTAKCKLGQPSTDGFASGAFPASSMSVQAILNYEATVPPFNGNAGTPVWYAGVRKLQEIAKNTFDQINNQQAFAP
jgi:hypothetical protein